MSHPTITLPRTYKTSYLAHNAQPYWSILQGEFPWCLDESMETDASSELIGCFDLIVANPPRIIQNSGLRMRNALDRCRPDTNWLSYTELFMREGGSMLIFTTLESVGAYIRAINEVGLTYAATYLCNSELEEAEKLTEVEAILWVSKNTPRCKPLSTNESLINLSTTNSYLTVNKRDLLMEALVAAFTEREMLVLEPFMTNGQLLVACQKQQRYCLALARKRSHIKQVEHTLLGLFKQTA